jgi:outer membrane lipoprotein carrier protein
VAKVQAFYDKTTTFKADFVQEFVAKLHNTKKVSKGVVTFVKPGKMYFEYADPEGNRVISDGATLRVYEKSANQMFEQVVDKSQYPAALSFLTGTGKLTDSFTFEQVEGEKMGFKGGLVLTGTPKQPSAAYKKVLFYVDKATWQVRRVLILDAQGNRNRFDFNSPKVNEPVPAETFRFTPPPGTTIVKP